MSAAVSVEQRAQRVVLAVHEERGHPHGREPFSECAPLEVLPDRRGRLLAAFDANAVEIVGPRDARIGEVVRPEQAVASSAARSRSGTLTSVFSLRASSSSTRSQASAVIRARKFRLYSFERVALGAERVDADDPEEPFAMREREVEGKLPAPRVSDDPCPVDPVLVEHGQRVRRVYFHRVGRARVGGLDPALRVAGRRHERREFGCEGLRVVGDAGTAV